MTGIIVKTNARHARQLEALLSPTRTFVGIDRGKYFMEGTEVQALRDYDFLVSQRLVAPEGITLIEEEQS